MQCSASASAQSEEVVSPESNTLKGTSVLLHRNDFLRFLSPTFQAETSNSSFTSPKRSLVIINSATPYLDLIVERLWPHLQLTLCADGGANRLFHSFPISNSANSQRDSYVPDFIVGDLDSLQAEVTDFYGTRGSIIIRNPDQYSNDLDKTLSVLQEQWRKLNTSSIHDQEIIILGAFGGRFDQEMANIHALFRWQEIFPRMLLLDVQASDSIAPEGSAVSQDVAGSVMFLLSATPQQKTHQLHLLRGEQGITEGLSIGLVPMGGRVECISTSGLVWNLHEHSLQFGELISTSNRIQEDTQIITVNTSHPVIWTSSFTIQRASS
jgi:thiamine pyrophosphokinase